MTTKAKEDVKATEAAPAKDKTAAPAGDKVVEQIPVVQEKTAAKKTAPGDCAVDDGTPHTGRATPGAKICSAHAIHYKADGTPR